MQKAPRARNRPAVTGRGAQVPYGTIFSATAQRTCRRRHLCAGRAGLYHGLRRAQAHQLRPRRPVHHRRVSGADSVGELQSFRHPGPRRRRAGRLRDGGAAGGPSRLPARTRGLPAPAQGQPPLRRGFRPRGLHLFPECGHAHLRGPLLRLPRLSAP